MAERDDGGPAFSRPMVVYETHPAEYRDEQEGMSLRDYFAAQAFPMCFSLANSSGLFEPWRAGAFEAYKCADALLIARGQATQETK